MLKARYSSPWNVNAEDFTNIIQIPSSAYNPKFSVDSTPAPQNLPNNYFVKKPQLISYDRISQGPRPDSIAEDLLKEARIYGLLKRRPHPNTATYLGCQISDGTITGLCLKRYPHMLMKVVNPRGLMNKDTVDTLAEAVYITNNKIPNQLLFAMSKTEKGNKRNRGAMTFVQLGGLAATKQEVFCPRLGEG
ncbi:hypothetical protein HAV15_010616 [Penicillium sp. str. |nr:hypothetical protein HAV15_010616 [Penicillium sp. str. \